MLDPAGQEMGDRILPEQAFGHKRVSYGTRPAVMDQKSTPLVSPLGNRFSDPNPTPSK